MWLPSKKQVVTAQRYAIVVTSTVFAVLGLQAKGFELQGAINYINRLGDIANTAIAVGTPLVVAYQWIRGILASSPSNQIAAVKYDAANGSEDAKAALVDAAASLSKQDGPTPVGT